ncbi:MAG: M20/M25/M40 family metallo-hydrolase [Coriobacteriia bacterium]|nr:M20/M25/M40 family metallo-hydrolase [Coriobacteriia bacterium]MCL2750828.1 M20/M25/M40 family metallo-hydrolase [Coriobacteriia bacterium]
MNKKDLAFLKELTEAPSPSGFEVPAATVFRTRIQAVANKVETNVLGSVHATLLGKGAGPSLMITGHLDEIGLMVTYISDEGFISFQAIGGVDAAILPGMRVNICPTGEDAKPGQVLRGVMGRKPIHLIEQDDRKVVTKIDQLFIDVGMEGKKLKKLVRIGDAITFGVGFEELGDGFAVARAFDDKLGVWVAARVLEEIKKAGGAAGDVIAAGTVQEEIGIRGGTTSAYGINPDIGISVEVGHATDYPDINKRKHGQYECGKGPLIARGPNINPVLFERMVAAAKKTRTAYQIAPESRATGTDANAIQLARGGKVAGLISVPIRYMHTPNEVVKLSDLDATVKILTRFILDLDEKVDFVPR